MLTPSLPYMMLKFSLKLYRLPPDELPDQDYAIVTKQAGDEWKLHEKILNSPERLAVVIPEQSIQEAVQAIGSRYPSPEEFEQDLKRNNMDIPDLTSALEMELTVEAITTLVASGAKPPTEEEMEAQLRKTDREKPEQRFARHILITINDEFPENQRENAETRITLVRNKTLAPEADFSRLAERYSECPSALKGGSLGPITRGRIHPSLEKAIFALDDGEISEVVESNMGFHILFCEEVIAASTIAKATIMAQIRQALLQKSRRTLVQTWLAAL